MRIVAKLSRVTFIFFCFFGLISETLADKSLLVKVDEIRAPGAAFSVDVTLITPDKKKLKMSVRVKDQLKSLVRYLEPARSAGRAILFVERNMWIYIPGSRRALRISPQQQILGGIASADIARMVYSFDYQVDRVEPMATDNRELRRRLILTRKSKSAAYERVNLIVGGEEARPLYAELYSTNGERLLKTAFFEGYKEILGKYRPTILRVVDNVGSHRQTVIKYSNYQLEDTPSAYFQPAYLPRLK